MRYFYAIVGLNLFIIGMIVGSQLKPTSVLAATPSLQCKPWFDIPKDVEEKLLAKHVAIKSGNLVGSGCKIQPGYYLTAYHNLYQHKLIDADISVDNQKAQLVAHSDLEADVAIVSTFAEYSINDIKLEDYTNLDIYKDVILVGSPGALGVIVQPATIWYDAVFEGTAQKKPGAKVITAQYIKKGISGACVYSRDGEKLISIVTKMYDSDSIGEISSISRNFK